MIEYFWHAWVFAALVWLVLALWVWVWVWRGRNR